MFYKTKLKSGLRLITCPQTKTKTVTLLVMVGTGSKYETKDQAGLSHFLEHLFFKGTKKRPSTLAISTALDEVGGEYNAFTSKEYTGFYVKVASKHIERAFDVISDILQNSKFEPEEIKREKKVIVEEINMIQDTPMHYIGELFEKLLYQDQPAGRMTIGEKKTVLVLKRKNFLDYLQKMYKAPNMVVCLAGNISLNQAKKLTKKYFAKLFKGKPRSKPKVKEKQQAPQILVHYKKTDQTHLCLGFRGYHIKHPDRYILLLLATILGGSMSSRLFISIRERRGLAYYIKASPEFYTDSGYLVIQAGVPNQKVAQAICVILDELKKIKEKGASKKELKKAKEFIKGNTLLNLETSDAQALWLAKQEILTKKLRTLKQIFADLNKVKPSDIQRVARQIFKNKKLNLALIGPHKNKKIFRRILKI